MTTARFSCRAGAAFFGISPTSVDRVCSGESWREGDPC